MDIVSCRSLCTESWKDLYEAAIHETDLSALPERINHVEIAIAVRMRELSHESRDKFDEKESLDDAMCALDALRRSLKRRSKSVPQTNSFGQLMLSAG
jgi:hypothetical protein